MGVEGSTRKPLGLIAWEIFWPQRDALQELLERYLPNFQAKK